jgi:hypothetical protein
MRPIQANYNHVTEPTAPTRSFTSRLTITGRFQQLLQKRLAAGFGLGHEELNPLGKVTQIGLGDPVLRSRPSPRRRTFRGSSRSAAANPRASVPANAPAYSSWTIPPSLSAGFYTSWTRFPIRPRREGGTASSPIDTKLSKRKPAPS